MTDFNFSAEFNRLTGHPPLSWQIRLFKLFDEFLKGPEPLPSIIDLPTGMGKTMVMAIWLLARSRPESKLPRRLIYVVDRRTVVDQATDLATKLQEKYDKDKLAISTLRGQLADNREWSKDPSKPAIIIGTVDLIGSGLLFSGYRSSYKRRPLEAGLLGQDSLLVLDEAHLSKPFEKLIASIARFQIGQGTPTKVVTMSATTPDADANRFKLEESDFSDPIITERFKAKKTLTIEQSDAVDAKLFADEAVKAPVPGRPEVAPWLRGIDDDLPQTTIGWRAELDEPGFDQLDLETIEEWLDTHRVLPHETLSVPTSSAAKTLLSRWSALDEQEQKRVGRHHRPGRIEDPLRL